VRAAVRFTWWWRDCSFASALAASVAATVAAAAAATVAATNRHKKLFITIGTRSSS
jgi:DNA primase